MHFGRVEIRELSQFICGQPMSRIGIQRRIFSVAQLIDSDMHGH
jgi:hypothetical protein